jgi:hypothetical protein
MSVSAISVSTIIMGFSGPLGAGAPGLVSDKAHATVGVESVGLVDGLGSEESGLLALVHGPLANTL